MRVRSVSSCGRSVGVLAMTLLLGLPAPALAEPTLGKDDVARAAALYEQGNKHFALGEWDQAISSFREAYRISEASGFLYNIAQAYRRRGGGRDDCKNAREFYKNYLVREPAAANRDAVEKRIKEMEVCLEAREASVSTPAPPDGAAGTGPAPAEPAPVGGGVDTSDVGGIAPVVEGREVRSGARAPSSATEQQRGSGWKKWTGLGVGGAGLVAVGVAAYFSVQGGNKQDELRDRCTPTCSSDVALELDAEGASANRKAYLFYGVGGAALIAGGVLFYLGLRDGSAETTTAVVPSAEGAVVTWSGRF